MKTSTTLTKAAAVIAVVTGVVCWLPQQTASAAGVNWASLEQHAVAAIARYDDAGPVQSTSAVPETPSSISINGKSVSVQNASLTSTDQSGTYMTTLSWLGNQQLLVYLIPTSGGSETTALELSPGTFQTTGVSHSPISQVPAGTTPGGIQPDLTTTWFYLSGGSCEAGIVQPGTEGSIYGELIYGIGAFVESNCPTTYAALTIGLYYYNGYTGVGLNDTTGASGNPSSSPGVSAVAYYPCSAGGPVYFQTAGYFSALNEGDAYAASDWSYLGCAA